MAYSLPQFNLEANIWDCRWPADGDPDWELVPVQKYIRSRMSLDVGPQVDAGWWQQWVPPIQLRFPRLHLAFVDPPALWSHLCFEVPAGSGQYYRVRWQEVQHQGFPNEYAIILVTPCDETGLAIPPPSADTPVGAANDICVSPPPPPPDFLDDQFEDTPGENLEDHPMTQGPGWLAVESGVVWVIGADGDTAVLSVEGADQGAVMASDGGFTDGTWTVNWEVVDASGDRLGIAFRIQDSLNFYALVVNCGDGEVNLVKVVAGLGTNIDFATLTTPPSNGDHFRFEGQIVGDAITATVTRLEGPDVYNLSGTDSTFPTGTRWGMYSGLYTYPLCENFYVIEVV